MTSSENEPNLEADDADDADDATLAASDDVVAQIRAHAARVRRGEIGPDEELHVWTRPAAANKGPVADGRAVDSADPSMFEEVVLDVRDDDAGAAAAAVADAGQRFVGEADRLLLPSDETIAFTPSPATPPSQPVQGSLIDGLEPPHGSATFWTSDKTNRAGGIDFGPRHRAGAGLPTWVWIALAVIIIILISVGIAVAIAVSSTGTVT